MNNIIELSHNHRHLWYIFRKEVITIKTKNLKGDITWLLVLALWIFLLAVPVFRAAFLKFTEAVPYIGGFIKFSVLATMGDLLGLRIQNKEWVIPKGIVFKAILWGIIGMMVTLVFTVYSSGARTAQAAGLLPFANSQLASALFASAIMNLTFGPMMFIYHKYGDLYIEAKLERADSKSKERITVRELTEKLDWHSMVGFSWLITCPLVWIPLHTVVLLLPSAYRVLASAFLSILLGVVVVMAKMVSSKSEDKVDNKAAFSNRAV